MDVVDKKTRSKMMAGIKATNTQPEKFLRSYLHQHGFRFRIHAAKLPGKPDIILPRYHAAILVHGCFWHGHGCALFKWPATRRKFWQEKIQATCKRDAKNIIELKKLGWRVAVIWECEIRNAKNNHYKTMKTLKKWLDEGITVAF
jgi:DNA mismatch endonuclease (patch repair protein)